MSIAQLEEELTVLNELRRTWFELAQCERYPNTPEITAKLNVLTRRIKEIKDGQTKV